MSTDQLVEIYIRSRLLHERMGEDWAATDPEAAQRRLKTWHEVIAKGDRKRFQRRLLWDGWTEERIAPYLGGRASNLPATLPEWTGILREIIAASREVRRSDLPGEPIPFEEALFPAIAVARRRLETSSHIGRISDDACRSLQRSLLLRLSKISLGVFGEEFSRFRPAGLSFLGLVTEENEKADRTQYDQFLKSVREDGLICLLLKYPVWARAVASITQFWIDRTLEFLNRLASDFPERRVAQLLPDLSDPHRQGRTVMSLQFDSGEKLVYKPKDPGPEVAFNGFLEWCNGNGAPLSFRTLSILGRQQYGWAEFVEHQPCIDDAAIQRYYRRAGMLLCTLYVLRATDCLRSNLIASGEHPVLIDAETLMHERLPDQADDPYFNSVLAVGLLPVWQAGADDLTACDISGFGFPEIQDSPRKRLNVRFPNTDMMTFAYEQGHLPVGPSVPRLNSKPVAAADHVSDITDGFESMYRFFIAHRGQLLQPNGPLSRFKESRVRFLLRSTSVYGLLIQHAFKPEFLGDGADCGIQLDALSRAFTAGDEKPSTWPFLKEETAAAAQMDVPWFSAEPDYLAVTKQLQNLNDAGMRAQTLLIADSFHCQRVAIHTLHEETASTDSVSGVDLILEARKIAAQLSERTWIGPFFTPVGNRYRLDTLKDDVYAGRSGIALFLAALHHVTGDEQYRAQALAALAGVRSGPNLHGRIGVGGLTGLGSIVYALTRIGVFLKEPALLDLAIEYSREIDSDLIARDKKLDIVSGSAGAILGLLALYSERKDSEVLETAVRCGIHVIKNSTDSAANVPAGFSHGATGLAYSLHRLSEVTGDAHFRIAVRKEKSAAVSWCRGAPGIALSRFAEPEIDDGWLSADGVDQLCCGNLGRGDILISLGRREEAEELAQRVLARKEKAGNYRLIARSAQQVFVPGFFRGVAGIGYALLRLSQPELPSILALE